MLDGGFFYYRLYIQRRYMGYEDDDPGAVPISDAEAYRMQDALSRVNTLPEMGIHPVARWRLVGRCSWHGQQVHIIETTEGEPTERYINCWSCMANDVTKRLPVLDRQREVST